MRSGEYEKTELERKYQAEMDAWAVKHDSVINEKSTIEATQSSSLTQVGGNILHP